MQCPTCGYIMDAFDSSCKRCARAGTQAATTSATMPPPPTAAPLPQPTMAPPKPTMVKRPPREPIMEPELGWTLTVTLWVLIGLHALVTLLLLGAALFFAGADNAVAAVIFTFLGPGVRLVALIAMLRCQRWGFYLYCVFAIAPAALSLMSGNLNPWRLAFDTIPGILILVLVIAKWDQFE